MTKEPRVNLDRLVSDIVLDCSLLRWFAYNGRPVHEEPKKPRRTVAGAFFCALPSWAFDHLGCG
jgi:hypothetical protein